MFGKIPPPIGGVTVSLKNLINSLSVKGICADILAKRNFFKRYDVAHIHYSNLLKRAIGVCFAKLFCAKVIFTVHGKYLDCSNIYNRISIFFADGIIVLNERLFDDVVTRIGSTKISVLPSLFVEGLPTDEPDIVYFKPTQGKKNLLLYAYDRTFRDNEEIYGVEFILSNLKKLPDEYNVLLLDISGKYRDLVDNNEDRVVYINKVVNFVALLKQVDIYIRPTCMDGASVAVQEAQLAGVPVLASDVVDRPPGVETFKYKDINDFVIKLVNLKTPENKPTLKSVDLYIKFCNSL